MSRPLTQGPTVIWAGRESSQTLTYLPASNSDVDPSVCHHLKLFLTGAGFFGSLNVQTSADGSNWTDIPYTILQNPLPALITGARTYVGWTGAEIVVVPNGPWPRLRLVMVRDGGSLSGVVLASGSDFTNLPVSGLESPLPTQEVEPATYQIKRSGSDALSVSTPVLTQAYKLLSIMVHFSAAPTTSQSLTATLNSEAGSAYDTLLLSTNPSVTSATDIVYVPDRDVELVAGDAIDVAFTNTDNVVWGLQIVMEPR